METYKLYIGGEFVDAGKGETYQSINPYNNEPIADIPLGSEKDAARAAYDEALTIYDRLIKECFDDR